MRISKKETVGRIFTPKNGHLRFFREKALKITLKIKQTNPSTKFPPTCFPQIIQINNTHGNPVGIVPITLMPKFCSSLAKCDMTVPNINFF